MIRLDEVKPLAALSRTAPCESKLIPYNKVEGLAWERPSEAAQQAFLAALQEEKVLATLRREKGHDIDAACGQLRLRTSALRLRIDRKAMRQADSLLVPGQDQ